MVASAEKANVVDAWYIFMQGVPKQQQQHSPYWRGVLCCFPRWWTVGQLTAQRTPWLHGWACLLRGESTPNFSLRRCLSCTQHPLARIQDLQFSFQAPNPVQDCLV